jgi:hypothetical protein
MRNYGLHSERGSQTGVTIGGPGTPSTSGASTKACCGSGPPALDRPRTTVEVSPAVRLPPNSSPLAAADEEWAQPENPAGEASRKMDRSVAEKLPRWGVGCRQSECRALSVELRVPEAFHAGAKRRSRPALSPPGASHSKRARANCLTSHNLQAKLTGVPALWISASPR